MMQVHDQPRDDSPPGGSVASAGAAGSCCASGLQKLLSPQLFKALADPRRLALLMRLADGGRPFTVGQLAEGSGVDLSVVSRHLAVLREAGVIKCVKQGKEVWCTVQTRAVAQILRDLAAALETCCAEAVCTPAGTETPELAAARRAERQPA
jgi:DNA-binding transcriptional ArsR family regulator